MTSVGIDYGMGRTNVNHKTGIRYGVISQHSCPDFWAEAEADYGKPDAAVCPDCGAEYHRKKGYSWGDNVWCRKCQKHFDLDLPDCCEPCGFYVDDSQYQCTSCLDSDIMIISSPYFTYGPFCSPCVPGAVNLDSADEYGPDNGAKAYCLGHDAFEHSIAPYRVWRIADGKEIVATRQSVECPNCKGKGKDSLERLALARHTDLATVKSDLDLMARLATLNYDEHSGTFDCWRCNGSGKIEETVETEQQGA